MLKLGETKIDAVSVGGLETCIELPAWDLCFDIGRCPPTAVRRSRVLFTHGHCDHMGGVAHHCSQRDLMGMKPPEYWMPQECREGFDDLMAAWRRIDRSSFPHEATGVSPGDRFSLGKKRWARVFRAVHRIPAVGYALGTTNTRLKPEYAGRSTAEIRTLVHAGETVTQEHETIEVVFCGDTSIDVLERETCVRTAKILILEVTFLDDRVSVESARRHGHVHLDEVLERAHLFENEHVVFTHFSARYSSREIQRILNERLPPSLQQRVHPLLPGPPWEVRAET